MTTIQDLGRPGFAHLGISAGGAADAVSFRIANLLVGNQEDAPALEMTLLGATLSFEERTVIAVTGGDCECQLEGVSIPLWTAVEVKAGTVLKCGSLKTGARIYLAVRGGFRMSLIMGSAATDIQGRFGGFQGRKMRTGDMLTLNRDCAGPTRAMKPGFAWPTPGSAPIRVSNGAQLDWFSPDVYQQLFSHGFTVSDQWDRKGVRLKAAPVIHRSPGHLLTEGIPLGAIQVPPDGNPIILFVDQATTGGYPKIANVVAADLHRIGQLRSNDSVSFAEVSIGEAVRLLRERELWLKSIWE
jgi:antagonist of KipI